MARGWRARALTVLVLSTCTLTAAAPRDGCNPRPADLSPLPDSIELKDVNLLFTTDSHSWLAGHSHPDNDPLLDASLADVLDFTHALKAAAAAEQKDLFAFDNGDIVDGTALSNIRPDKVSLVAPLFRAMPYTCRPSRLASSSAALYECEMTGEEVLLKSFFVCGC